jgi:MFS family permease
MGRLIAGTAASFAFPGVSQMIRLNSNGRQFSLAMALLESCIGFGSAAVTLLLLWAPNVSWRSISALEALLALMLAGLMTPGCRRAWHLPPRSSPRIADNQTTAKASMQWPIVIAAAGVYAWEAGLTFAFGGFWSLWLERQQMLNAHDVTIGNLVLFLAVGLGTAAFGVFATTRIQRCRCLLIGTTTGGIILIGLLNLSVAQQGRFHLPAYLLFGLSTAVGGLAFGEAGLAAPPARVAQVIGLVNGLGCLAGGLFHVLPTSLMVLPSVDANLVVWFGLLALIGWLAAIDLWRRSRLGIRPRRRQG